MYIKNQQSQQLEQDHSHIARYLSEVTYQICTHLKLPFPEMYFDDLAGECVGQYIFGPAFYGLRPWNEIVMAKRLRNGSQKEAISVLLHELAHHYNLHKNYNETIGHGDLWQDSLKQIKRAYRSGIPYSISTLRGDADSIAIEQLNTVKKGRYLNETAT